MILYDKNGNEYNIPHAIDAREWVASGEYFFSNPMGEKIKSVEDTEVEPVKTKASNKKKSSGKVNTEGDLLSDGLEGL